MYFRQTPHISVKMSLSQLDSDGSRLASLGADGVLSVWSHVQGNIPILGQKVTMTMEVNKELSTTSYADRIGYGTYRSDA